MKVFISWSGIKSHKVAMIFREWLPSVIQSLEPYVSSEDIDKGARWSTDIAKELEDSTFGILCVTRENIEAPWLSFEAGALSKTMDKSFVSPFLFDMKRSEVNGPILQFQSTIFQKEDIKKLVITLNKACEENCISDERLNKAFEVWYPTLEEELNKLKEVRDPNAVEMQEKVIEEIQSSEILEEILELSRDNQKLLKNPDSKIEESLRELSARLESTIIRYENNSRYEEKRMTYKYKIMFLDELMHTVLPESNSIMVFFVIISFYKDDFPWIYNMGKELFDVMQSKVDDEIKMKSVRDFQRLIEFTFEHPMIRELYFNKKENMRIFRDQLPYLITKSLNNFQDKFIGNN